MSGNTSRQTETPKVATEEQMSTGEVWEQRSNKKEPCGKRDREQGFHLLHLQLHYLLFSFDFSFLLQPITFWLLFLLFVRTGPEILNSAIRAVEGPARLTLISSN